MCARENGAQRRWPTHETHRLIRSLGCVLEHPVLSLCSCREKAVTGGSRTSLRNPNQLDGDGENNLHTQHFTPHSTLTVLAL